MVNQIQPCMYSCSINVAARMMRVVSEARDCGGPGRSEKRQKRIEEERRLLKADLRDATE